MSSSLCIVFGFEAQRLLRGSIDFFLTLIGQLQGDWNWLSSKRWMLRLSFLHAIDLLRAFSISARSISIFSKDKIPNLRAPTSTLPGTNHKLGKASILTTVPTEVPGWSCWWFHSQATVSGRSASKAFFPQFHWSGTRQWLANLFHGYFASKIPTILF